MAQVQLINVWKKFGDVVAVEDANLTIKDQEFVVLVGPSGCGKTTTLRMVAGLEEITQGTIMIGDRKVNDLHPKDRDIAMVFQNYALYPHMTVRDNLNFSLRLRKFPKKEIEERVLRAATILGIENMLDRKPKQLSGGQRQRVAMGRAIVRDPQVFLFDEPLSNLDAKLRVQMRLEIARLHRNLGATIIYVTHDQVEAMTLAERIVVMKDGKIQQVGSPDEVFNRPVNTFVGTFIGSPSMNLLQAEVDSGRPVLSGAGYSFTIDEKLHRTLKEAGETKVTMGIRPQHLTPTDDPNAPGFDAVVDMVEPLGAESFLYFSLGGSDLIAHAQSSVIARGTSTRFTLDTNKLHLFSADGTRRLG
ncbi:MAG: sn-glycerol-3-phosphate ABC transporter ATP-binding protein UgpC [Bradymonadales bacterium]|nr:sn-glycerol-3-phosphate ABC transporter ATP-binding protein UgpC [Bradymonadales bacterium]